MFTGIVEAVGEVVAVEAVAGSRRVRVRAPEVLEDLTVGGSVAVDGACVTAVEVHPDGFSVELIETTLARTVAGGYAAGTRVNLERAVRLGDRLDGHLVQGHVDGMGEVLGTGDDAGTRRMDLRLVAEVDAVTVLHGSITVNGVSLTVNALPAPGVCQVALIPHTLAVTTLGALEPGDSVNLEGDLIGKYVGRMLASWRSAGGTPDSSAAP